MFIIDLQVDNSNYARVLAKNPVGLSKPLECQVPIKVESFDDQTTKDDESDVEQDDKVTFSCSTTEQLWIRPEAYDKM